MSKVDRPRFDDEFIAFLAQGDAGLEKSAHSIRLVLDALMSAFRGQTNDVHNCKAKLTVRDHCVAHATMLHWLLGMRALENLTDFTDGLRRHRVLAAALAGRAFIETAAAIVYIDDEIGKRLRTSGTEGLLRELHRFIEGGRFPWTGPGREDGGDSLLRDIAKDKEPTMPEELRAPNVMTMLKRLDRRLNRSPPAVARFYYAMFSEFCHPASGAVLLYLDPTHRADVVRLRSDTGDRQVRWFFKMLGVVLGPVAMAAAKGLANLEEAVAEFAPDEGKLGKLH